MLKQSSPEYNEMAKKVPAQEIMDFWNGKPHLRKHTDKSSKVYIKSIEMINILLEGEFRSCCPVNEVCIEMNNITEEELSREWSPEEIMQAIERFDYMCSEEYINDKRYFPKNLPDFIYNFRTENSFMFSVLGEDREVYGRPIKILDQYAFDLYKRRLFPSELNDDLNNKLIKNINYIALQQRSFEERVGQFCFFHVLKEKSFYLRHLEYIQELYEGKSSFSVNYLGAFTFQGFSDWLIKKYNVELYPSKQKIAEMKDKFEVDKIELERSNMQHIETLNTRKIRACSRGLNRYQRKPMEDSIELNLSHLEQSEKGLERFKVCNNCGKSYDSLQEGGSYKQDSMCTLCIMLEGNV
jgi:hypothetical protein